MKMNKRQYRIGDLAKHLNVEKFVIRFWEKELNIKPKRSKGGQRFYQEQDFQTFKTVKELLYQKKFTIAGAKEELQRLKSQKKTNESTQSATIIPTQKILSEDHKSQLYSIREKVVKLQKKLTI